MLVRTTFHSLFSHNQYLRLSTQLNRRLSKIRFELWLKLLERRSRACVVWDVKVSRPNLHEDFIITIYFVLFELANF